MADGKLSRQWEIASCLLFFCGQWRETPAGPDELNFYQKSKQRTAVSDQEPKMPLTAFKGLFVAPGPVVDWVPPSD